MPAFPIVDEIEFPVSVRHNVGFYKFGVFMAVVPISLIVVIWLFTDWLPEIGSDNFIRAVQLVAGSVGFGIALSFGFLKGRIAMVIHREGVEFPAKKVPLVRLIGCNLVGKPANEEDGPKYGIDSGVAQTAGTPNASFYFRRARRNRFL